MVVWAIGDVWPPADGQRLDCSSSVAESIAVSLVEDVVKFVDDLVNSDVVALEVEASTDMIALRC